MEINERIKSFRKNEVALTQDEFAKRLHISRSNLGNIEIGRIAVTDRVILDICKSFNVSEHWLRTGDGDMYVQTENSLINQLKREYNLDERRAAAIESFLDLKPEMQDALLDGIFALADNIKSHFQDEPLPDPSAAHRKTPTDVKRAIVNSELAAEEKGKTS